MQTQSAGCRGQGAGGKAHRAWRMAQGAGGKAHRAWGMAILNSSICRLILFLFFYLNPSFFIQFTPIMKLQSAIPPGPLPARRRIGRGLTGRRVGPYGPYDPYGPGAEI